MRKRRVMKFAKEAEIVFERDTDAELEEQAKLEAIPLNPRRPLVDDYVQHFPAPEHPGADSDEEKEVERFAKRINVGGRPGWLGACDELVWDDDLARAIVLAHERATRRSRNQRRIVPVDMPSDNHCMFEQAVAMGFIKNDNLPVFFAGRDPDPEPDPTPDPTPTPDPRPAGRPRAGGLKK